MENTLIIDGEEFKSIPCDGNEYFYINCDGTKIYNTKRDRFVSIFPHSHPRSTKSYLGCHLNNNTTYNVHRLVALAWLPNPEGKKTVDHKDRNTLNNHVSNLCWATPKEQIANSDNSLLRDKEYQREMSRKGAEARSKAVCQYDIETGKLLGTFKSSRQAAVDVFGDKGKDSYINRCAHGKIKAAYGYIWKFKE